MIVRTNLKAGDLLNDLASGVQSAGIYVGNLINEANAQATQLTNSAVTTVSDVIDCLNTKRQAK